MKANNLLKDIFIANNTKEICNNNTECNPILQTVKIAKKKKFTGETLVEKLSPKKIKTKKRSVWDSDRNKQQENNTTPVIVEKGCNDKIYKCDTCKKSYELISRLNIHKKKAHISKDVCVVSSATAINNDNAKNGTLLKNNKNVKKRKATEEISIQILSPKSMKTNKIQKNCSIDHKEQLKNLTTRVIQEQSCYDQIYKCDVCDKSFEFISSLNKHKMKTHTNVSASINNMEIYCDDQIECKTLLNKINEKIKKKKPSKDTQIKTFSPTEMKSVEQQIVCNTDHDKPLENVICTVHMDKIYKCDACKKSYKFISSLNKHKQQAHGVEKDKNTTIASNVLNRMQDDEEYTSLIKRHIKKLKKKKELFNKMNNPVKTIPPNKTKNQTMFYEPYNQYLESNNVEINSYKTSISEIFECDICEDSFKCLSALNEHKTVHIDNQDEQYSCGICNRTFKFASSLSFHTSIHLGKNPENPTECNICSKSFFSTSDLYRHFRSHTGEKRFACSVCGSTFADNSYLTVHSRTHTGEKPFTCNICGVQFAQKGTLVYHYRIHTKEKPYKCEVCGAKFSVKMYLTIHNRIHSGEKPFTCIVCGMAFARKSTLICHKRIHTGEKPYKCGICDMSFRSSSCRLQHTRNKHHSSY